MLSSNLALQSKGSRPFGWCSDAEVDGSSSRATARSRVTSFVQFATAQASSQRSSTELSRCADRAARARESAVPAIRARSGASDSAARAFACSRREWKADLTGTRDHRSARRGAHVLERTSGIAEADRFASSYVRRVRVVPRGETYFAIFVRSRNSF